MSHPDVVTQELGGEQSVAEVDLGGEDHLYVTPTRTLIYRADGLLSDETVEEYPHDAERISVSEGRRKAKVTMDYGLDGEESFSLPKSRLDDALHPVIAGVLNAAGITAAGETVKRTFRFSELTLVVTSDRVVKHIGQAVWDDDFEEFHFEDVTDLTFEHGNVATSVVLSLGGRQERFKAPNEEARAVQEAITSALLDYHDVGSLEELRLMFADEKEEEPTDETDPFGEGPDLLSTGGDDEGSEDPLGADPIEAETTGSNGGLGQSTEPVADDGFTPATESVVEDSASASTSTGATDAKVAELAAEVEELRQTVADQQAQMERQNDLFEQLIEELRQGR
jgi:hypothetical protein